MNSEYSCFVFKNEVHCKNATVFRHASFKGKSGLAITFVLKCFACPYRVKFSSSNFHEGTQIATINTRFVYAMRSVEKVRSRENVLRRNESSATTYKVSPFLHDKRILNAAKLVYEDSIQKCWVKEAICEMKVTKKYSSSCRWTWQKRGYTSLNGMVLL
ncbi:uncharacterized protein TNCV_1811121 [Trichonephila clavipes]|nr:uncharacterized protein TNCV_1811121 [Trichonephila clavipes]